MGGQGGFAQLRAKAILYRCPFVYTKGMLALIFILPHYKAYQLANLARLANKSACNFGYQFHPLQNRLSEALASIQAVLHLFVC